MKITSQILTRILEELEAAGNQSVLNECKQLLSHTSEIFKTNLLNHVALPRRYFVFSYKENIKPNSIQIGLFNYSLMSIA